MVTIYKTQLKQKLNIRRRVHTLPSCLSLPFCFTGNLASVVRFQLMALLLMRLLEVRMA